MTRSSPDHAAPPRWFWIAALVAVAWNAMGAFMYLSSVGLFGDPTVGLSEAERAFDENMPAWITAAFATGTLAGLAGSVGLLLRRRWALPLVLVSLVALLLLEGWIIFLSGALPLFGLGLPLTVVSGALLLTWLAFIARGKGWLR
jgi:hypothetical protein